MHTILHPLIDRNLPFGLAAALVANQPHIANLAHSCLRKEVVDGALVGLQVDATHEHCAVVPLGFFGLLLRFFEILGQLLLLTSLLFGLIGTGGLVASVVGVSASALALFVRPGSRSASFRVLTLFGFQQFFKCL